MQAFYSIIDSELVLNKNGEIIKNCLFELELIYKNVKVDYYVIMPNHIHFILIIDNDKNNVGVGFSDLKKEENVGVGFSDLKKEENVGVGFSDPNNVGILKKGGKTPPLPTLGNIIAFFKYNSTKEFNNLRNANIIKLWQRNYYEHIIRNDKELLYEIRNYIQNNPLKWALDEYYN
jgi:putative transposase